MPIAKDVLEERAEQQILREIDDAVESSPNPDLAKVVLMNSTDSRSFFFNTAHEYLQTTKEAVLAVVEHLLKRKIVGINEVESWHTTEEKEKYASVLHTSEMIRKLYLCSDLPFGPHALIRSEVSSGEKVRKVMESVANAVKFNYSRDFHFDDLTLLRSLKERSHEALKPIRVEEVEFWHERLGIPKQFTSGVPSFVHENDPTKCNGYDQRDFTLSGSFETIEEAFKVGFDEVSGSPTITPCKGKFQTYTGIPGGVEIRRRKDDYSIELTNCWQAIHFAGAYDTCPLSLRREAKKITSMLERRLTDVLAQ